MYTFSHSACLRAFHVTIVTDVKALQWCCTSRQNGLSETWYHAGRRNVTQSTVSVGQSVQCWWGDPRVAMNGVVCRANAKANALSLRAVPCSSVTDRHAAMPTSEVFGRCKNAKVHAQGPTIGAPKKYGRVDSGVSDIPAFTVVCPGLDSKQWRL